MFTCDFCNKTTKEYEKMRRIVTHRRPRTYYNGRKRTEGWEIAEEKKACGHCAAKTR